MLKTINEIYYSLDNGLYKAALISALTLTDICGAINEPNENDYLLTTLKEIEYNR